MNLQMFEASNVGSDTDKKVSLLSFDALGSSSCYVCPRRRPQLRYLLRSFTHR